MKFYILIVLTLIYSCSSSSSKKEINEIELGMTVETVIEKLNIENSELFIIQEPPLIYRGINATLKDSTEISISFERIPANHNDISKEKGLEIVKKLKITGFAWKKKNGESGIIAEQPKFWIE